VDHDLESNKENAIAFYRTAYSGDPAKAVEMYVGPEYIQHNPLVGDGKQAFIEYFDEMARDYPGTGCSAYTPDLAGKRRVYNHGLFSLR
jgi:predicted SnoaL-like aldol condensation-catalyzing enzyme